jgi:hypothetical protein
MSICAASQRWLDKSRAMLGAKPVISGNPSVGPQVACLRRDPEFSRFFACVRKRTVVYREARSNYRRLKVQYFSLARGGEPGESPPPCPALHATEQHILFSECAGANGPWRINDGTERIGESGSGHNSHAKKGGRRVHITIREMAERLNLELGCAGDGGLRSFAI